MKDKQSGSDEVSRHERARWVARYRASGLGLKRFASEHGLKPGRLHYWAYTPGLASSAQSVTPVFQELRLGDTLSGSTGWGAEVVLSNGATVRLRAGVAPEWVGALIQALGGSCSR